MGGGGAERVVGYYRVWGWERGGVKLTTPRAEGQAPLIECNVINQGGIIDIMTTPRPPPPPTLNHNHNIRMEKFRSFRY